MASERSGAIFTSGGVDDRARAHLIASKPRRHVEIASALPGSSLYSADEGLAVLISW